ncbi:MAG TPA: arginyltransferase [Candidatus Xenobia bacterium]|jgi:arginine-tRNA-protein transferase
MPSGLPVYLSSLGECPYLPDRRWTLAVGAPRDLTAQQFDGFLSQGFRRMGKLIYVPRCQGCQACIPIRIPVRRFEFSKSQRRVLRKNLDVTLTVGPPQFTPDRLDLYRKFLSVRYPDKTPPTSSEYLSFFVQELGFTQEFQYRVGDRLVGLGIVDVTTHATSSVYFYFDPDQSRRSLGVYSLLQEISWCRETGREFVYLGFYVEDCRAMNYKALYRPHERRQPDGSWTLFE